MDKLSFNDDIVFNEDRVTTKVIIETSFSKEIRILLKSGQVMKEHKAPYPILIHILRGSIALGIEGEINTMGEGDIIGLNGGVPHDLRAIEDSILRLTLSKEDKLERVKSVVDN